MSHVTRSGSSREETERGAAVAAEAPLGTEFCHDGLPIERGAWNGPDAGWEAFDRALRSRANVLVAGDLAAARRFFRSSYPDMPTRFLSGEELNRVGLEGLRSGPGEGSFVLFLDRSEYLDGWMQAALLDALEAPPHPGSPPPIRRVIAGCEVDLGARVACGLFSRSLYLRLSTLRVRVGSEAARGGAGPGAGRRPRP